MVPIIVPTHPPPSLSPLTLAPTPPILPSLDTSIRSITYFLRNHATTTTPLSTIITELNSISRHETNLSNFMDVTPYTRDDCSLLSPHYAPPPPTQPHLLPCRGGGRRKVTSNSNSDGYVNREVDYKIDGKGDSKRVIGVWEWITSGCNGGGTFFKDKQVAST